MAPAHERPPAASEQTPYMPALPGVAECAPHLLPSPEWEASFLADFSDLRTVSPSVCLHLFSGKHRS